ncbi:hypothetical protein [Pontibacillus marinus]|uniref:Uncharacterized protein n=1 Tax=Pontibacillus marinus BH030004 = DSM 16465 TaxID=1385511 RepID=A0A0A5GK64_9BACI|nr:hypothetical protein [Pontibacillus marinus]KGX91515.1 hypothetical protein N783_07575 [Pontibacillus marinus BH030004 = DSM 16465]
MVKKWVGFLLIVVFFITIYNLKIYDYKGESLQEACRKKWNGCEVLNVDNNLGFFIFSTKNQQETIRISSFKEEHDTFYLRRTLGNSLSVGTFGALIRNTNFKDANKIKPFLKGKILLGYVSDKNVKEIELSYSIKSDQGYQQEVVSIPVKNQTFFYYTDNNKTHIYEELTPKY